MSQDLVAALAAGDVERVRNLYLGPGDIDDPYGGRQIDGGLAAMVRDWGPSRLLDDMRADVTHSTISSGLAGVEITMRGRQRGHPITLPLAVVSEIDGAKFLRTRLYYRRATLDGKQHWRNRILEYGVAHDALPDAVVSYQEGLRTADVDRIVSAFDETAVFDGHGGSHDLSKRLGMGRYCGKDAVRDAMSQMFAGSGGLGDAHFHLEHLNVVFDGRTAMIEFTVIHHNRPGNRVHPGVAFYETGGGARLREARVYDEAW